MKNNVKYWNEKRDSVSPTIDPGNDDTLGEWKDHQRERGTVPVHYLEKVHSTLFKQNQVNGSDNMTT